MTIRWLIAGCAALASLAAIAWTTPEAQAAAPGLQLNPLEYQSSLKGPDVENGFIDVANPGDTSINVVASVEGFRQADLAGDLSFFTSSQLDQGIVVGLPQFNLGPRQAVRVAFSVDPGELPKGGVYAVIFFRTVPPSQSSSTSFIAESANVGTLLLLQNGPAQDIGRIRQFSLGFWQFGSGLSGGGQYENTNATAAPVAFSPKLTSHVWPWGRATGFTGPLVLPGATRTFTFNRPGSYFGLLPVTLTDPTSGAVTIRWVLACTGLYAFALLIVVLLGLLALIMRLTRRSKTSSINPHPLTGLIAARLLRRSQSRETALGYRLTLKNSPPGWINTLMLADMTKTFRTAGLPCSGLNYFTLGEVKVGLSKRFDPDDPHYQAWLGGYLVQFDEPAGWSDRAYFKLPEADQIKWLRHFGDPAPEMKFEHIGDPEPIENNGFTGRALLWTGATHADLGPGNRSFHTRTYMEGMAQIMNQTHPGLGLKGKNFVPGPRNEAAYEPVRLAGYLAIFELEPKIAAVLYVCGTSELVKNVHTLEKLLEDTLVLEKR